MYKIRVKIFLTVIVLATLVMATRLMHLQVFLGASFRDEYEQMLKRTEFLPARRGRIIDRLGHILAEDHPCHDLCLHYGLLSQDDHWIRRQQRRLRREFGLSEDQAAQRYDQLARHTWDLTRRAAARTGVILYDQGDEAGVIDRILRRVRRMRRRVGTNVREQGWAHVIVPALDEDVALALRSQAEGTIGMEIRPSHRRRYPCGAAAAHVIGLTGQVNEAEQHRHNLGVDEARWVERMRRNYLAGDTLGKRGVEKMCEKRLRGRRGYVRYSAPGVVEHSEVARAGRDVHLTLDIDLQIRLAELFRRERAKQYAQATSPLDRCPNGCIVVLSVEQAEVLALVSVPTFDLNTYRKDLADLLSDQKDLPLLHRAVYTRYPPGSTVKPIAALAALGAGVISTHTTYHCTGYLFPNLRDRFRCWIAKRGGAHGTLNVVGGLQHSCNVFFYHVGERLGTDQLRDWFTRFGFADPAGTGLPEERAGHLPTERSRALARMMAIGQGGIEVTPLHMASAMVTLARGGRYLSPFVALEGGPRRVQRMFPLVESDAQAVREGMRRVVNDRRGTAWRIFHGSGVEELPFEICGKTGTAQTPPSRVDSNKNGRIDVRDAIVYRGDTAWFVGFAPADNPKIALAVMCEHAGGGGAHAGPIAREAFRLIYQLRDRGYFQ